MAAVDVLNDTSSESGDYEPIDNFEPIVQLPLVENKTHEEDESEMIKLRAKLYRFDNSVTPSEWKERGTGDVKLLHDAKKNTVRVVMRRDKTLKICANHFITPSITLQRPDIKRKNWWMWSIAADFADEVPKAEIFAMKFASEEVAESWRKKFTEAQIVLKNRNIQENTDENDNETESESENSSSSSSSKSDHEDEDTTEKCISRRDDGLSECVSKINLNK